MPAIYKVMKLETTIQTLAGNMAMLSNPFLKSLSHFLKKLISTKKKVVSFILTFKKSLSHFLKKVISLSKKGYLNQRKSFSTS